MWHFLGIATQVVERESLLAVRFATIQLCLMVPSYHEDENLIGDAEFGI